jgi:hypothetical protein
VDGREKILAEICPQGDPNADPVSGFYLRPGVDRLIESSRDGVEPAGWPGPVTALMRDATKQGWDVVMSYARGCMPHATTGRPGVERESYSVRFRQDSWQGYAIYAGGAWQSIMVTGRDLPPFGKLGRTDLGAWLVAPWPGGDARYDEVRERVAQQVARAKLRATERPKKGKGEAL